MGKPVIPVAYQFTAAQITAGDANNLPKGTSIIVIDINGQPTDVKTAQGGGQAPIEAAGLKNNLGATAAPISSNDSTQGYAVGSRWIDTTNNESYVCTKATNPASWSQTTVGVISEVAGLQAALDLKAPLASPTFTGTVTGVTKTMVGLGSVDNTSDASKPVSTAQQTALDGKSATTHNHDTAYTAIAHGTNVSNPHNVTATQVGLGNASNTSDANKPVSTAQQTALDLKVDKVTGKGLSTNDYTTAEQSKLSGIATGATANATDAQLRDRSTHTGSQAQSTITNLTTDLAAKQATLVSGTNIKTVNGASVVGAGNVSVAADLPGGSATTAYDDGLDAGNAVIDRVAVAGQTILKYETVGSSTFKVPTGVTSIDYLIVAGGGGGGKSIGAGGGAGGLLTATGYTVTPGATLSVSVGAGGAGATTTTAAGVNGTNSIFGAITPANGGGGGTGQSVGFPGGPGGSAGGSGGGGARNNTTGGAATPSGQGFAGGSGSDAANAYGAGGGGGAGGAGNPGSGTVGGSGGIGASSSITGTPTFYAGGGGGGVNAGTSGLGGSGIGGDAGTGGFPGGNGAAKTGSGGGGSESTANAGSGGSGIVIVRFTTQTRSYQALTGYANDSAAATGGILVGQFYRNSTSGATTQRAV